MALQVPIACGYETRCFAVDADAGCCAEPEVARHRGQAIEADLFGELVEVHVARLHDRRAHVDLAVYVTAAEAALAEVVVTWALEAHAGREHIVLERGERADGLEGRAGGVALVDGLFNQRAKRGAVAF